MSGSGRGGEPAPGDHGWHRARGTEPAATRVRAEGTGPALLSSQCPPRRQRAACGHTAPLLGSLLTAPARGRLDASGDAQQSLGSERGRSFASSLGEGKGSHSGRVSSSKPALRCFHPWLTPAPSASPAPVSLPPAPPCTEPTSQGGGRRRSEFPKVLELTLHPSLATLAQESISLGKLRSG